MKGRRFRVYLSYSDYEKFKHVKKYLNMRTDYALGTACIRISINAAYNRLIAQEERDPEAEEFIAEQFAQYTYHEAAPTYKSPNRYKNLAGKDEKKSK